MVKLKIKQKKKPSFPLAEEMVALAVGGSRGELSPPRLNARRLLTRSLLRSTTLSSPLAERGFLSFKITPWIIKLISNPIVDILDEQTG